MLHTIAPWFGYVASLCLVLALIINNDLRFRWLNSFGNIAFICYAMLLGTIPVLITNTILLGINIYYLLKIYRKKENFDLLEFKGNEKLAKKFIEYHHTDISNYFPTFTKEMLQQNLNFVITRDLTIANMFSASLAANGDAFIDLNYTLQRFRDYKIGSFIFEKEKYFLVAKGIKRLVYLRVDNKNHLAFLKVMGFRQEELGGKLCMIKHII